MKKYLNILALVVLVTAFASCSKNMDINEPDIENGVGVDDNDDHNDGNDDDNDDGNDDGNGDGNGDGNDNDGDTKEEIWLITEEKKNGQLVFTFKYDDKHRMVEKTKYLSPELKASEHYTYNAQGLLTLVEIKDGDQVLLTEKYTYNSNKEPISGVWENKVLGETSQVQYTNAGNIMKETVIKDSERMVYTYTFDSNRNLLKKEFGDPSLLMIVDEYNNYDDKVFRYTKNPRFWKEGSANNARLFKRTSVTINHPTVEEQTWSYTYNEAGCPVTAEVFDLKTKLVVARHTYKYIQVK